LALQTYTPADGAGEFANALNPRLRLLDATGNVVTVDDDGAPDGRNGLLNFVNTGSAATFYVKVSSTTAASTQGEYVLRVNGNSATVPAFRVAAVNPADGAVLRVVPTSVTLDFNHTIQLGTLAASDLKIDGISATSVTVVDADTKTPAERLFDSTGEKDGQPIHYLKQGDKFSFTFDKPGTYHFKCLPHPFMTGTIVVQ
jgi:plastocyanin